MQPAERYEYNQMKFDMAMTECGFTEVFSQPIEGQVVGYHLQPDEYRSAKNLCDMWNNWVEELNMLRTQHQFMPPECFYRRYCHISDVFKKLSLMNTSLCLLPNTPPTFEDGLSRETLEFRSQVYANM